jgi:hypothetical protein
MSPCWWYCSCRMFFQYNQRVRLVRFIKLRSVKACSYIHKCFVDGTVLQIAPFEQRGDVNNLQFCLRKGLKNSLNKLSSPRYHKWSKACDGTCHQKEAFGTSRPTDSVASQAFKYKLQSSRHDDQALADWNLNLVDQMVTPDLPTWRNLP